MLKVAIGGFDFEQFTFELLQVQECDSDDYEVPFRDYTKILTFENDGRYIVAGIFNHNNKVITIEENGFTIVVAGFDYEGSVLSSIRNFNTQEEADEYGKTLLSEFDGYHVVKI